MMSVNILGRMTRYSRVREVPLVEFMVRDSRSWRRSAHAVHLLVFLGEGAVGGVGGEYECELDNFFD